MADRAAASAVLLTLPFLQPSHSDTPSFGEELYGSWESLWPRRHTTKRDRKDSDLTGEGKPKFNSKKRGDNFQVHFGWTATNQNSNNATHFHLAYKEGSAFRPIKTKADLGQKKKNVKRLPLPYLRAATKDKKTKHIIDRIVGKVAPYVEELIRQNCPGAYAKMQGNAKKYRFPAKSIFTGGTISYMFARNTQQDVKNHKDEKDAKGTVGVSINETVGSVQGGNLVIFLPDGETLTVPANHAVVAAFKELEHVVNAPTGGSGCRVSIILQQNDEVVLAAEREESGEYLCITAKEKKQMVVDGVLEMNSNEKKRYGTRKEQSGDGD